MMREVGRDFDKNLVLDSPAARLLKSSPCGDSIGLPPSKMSAPWEKEQISAS